MTFSGWNIKFWITAKGSEIEDIVENEELEKESTSDKESDEKEEIETSHDTSFLINIFTTNILI